jgi:hypothetical protein
LRSWGSDAKGHTDYKELLKCLEDTDSVWWKERMNDQKNSNVLKMRWQKECIISKLQEYSNNMGYYLADLIKELYEGLDRDYLTKAEIRKKMLERKISLTRDDVEYLCKHTDTEGNSRIRQDKMLSFVQKEKQNWMEPKDSDAKISQENEKLKSRIKELEKENVPNNYGMKLNEMLAQLERVHNEKKAIEKKYNAITTKPHMTYILEMQNKIENLERKAKEREAQYKTLYNQSSHYAEIDNLKKQLEGKNQELARVMDAKNKEITVFKTELQELMQEMLALKMHQEANIN